MPISADHLAISLEEKIKTLTDKAASSGQPFSTSDYCKALAEAIIAELQLAVVTGTTQVDGAPVPLVLGKIT